MPALGAYSDMLALKTAVIALECVAKGANRSYVSRES